MKLLEPVIKAELLFSLVEGGAVSPYLSLVTSLNPHSTEFPH